MKVRYVHEKPMVHTGNILWDGAWPMRGGRFPPGHPVGGDSLGEDCQFGSGPGIEAFRSRGYWASCFPEGDGITLRCPPGKTATDAARDIAECFGWSVTIKH